MVSKTSNKIIISHSSLSEYNQLQCCAVFPAAVNMLYFTQQTQLLKPLLTVLAVCVSRNGNVRLCTYLPTHPPTHTLTHSLIHSLTEKSQDRLQMFGGLTALSNLLKDLVKQADTTYEDKLEDLFAFISHVIQTISEATHGNGK